MPSMKDIEREYELKDIDRMTFTDTLDEYLWMKAAIRREFISLMRPGDFDARFKAIAHRLNTLTYTAHLE